MLAWMVLAVILILRPGPDAAHAEADPAWTGSSADRLEGIGRVVDGDTLDVGPVRVRLHGIDAFERDQMCDGPRGAWACGGTTTDLLPLRPLRRGGLLR